MLTIDYVDNQCTIALDGQPVLATGPHAGCRVCLDGSRLAPPVEIVFTQTAHAITLHAHYVHAGGELRASQTFVVDPEAHTVERSVRICRLGGGEDTCRLTSVRLLLECLLPDDARFSIPMARLRPETPLADVLARPRDIGEDTDKFDVQVSAPDTIAGTVLAASRTLSATITPLPCECPAHTRLYGRAGRGIIEHEIACEAWLQEGTPVEVGAQTIHVAAQSWREALLDVGKRFATQGLAPPLDRPAWARNPVIFEAEPGFLGGLRAIEKRLPELRDIGFDTLYLMPWHLGGYSTIDYEAIHPDYGTLDDLRRLCDGAHALDMHVLFDLLVNIANDESAYVRDHADWFYRDAAGRLLPHPSWKSNCFDPASPGFRQFLTDYAVRCCDDWGADGFRVDAVAYRGGLWANRPGLQPHQHAHAVFSLVSDIRDAIRRGGSDRILLAECFGPLQSPRSDLVCAHWIAWLDWALERVNSGALDGAAIARILAEHFAVMPADTWLTTYTHTHDTVAFQDRDIQGPRIDALFAALALLSAGTLVFGGGWSMRARPDGREAEEYRSLFEMKRRLGGAACSQVRFLPSEDRALCMAERPSNEGIVRVATSFATAPRPFTPIGRRLYSRLGSGAREIAPGDTIVEVL